LNSTCYGRKGARLSDGPSDQANTYAGDVKSGLVNVSFPILAKFLLRILRLDYCWMSCVEWKNGASDLAKLLKTPVSDNLPYLKEGELPGFLRTLSAYEANPVLRIATKILLLTGVRTMELRLA
jgi:integrase